MFDVLVVGAGPVGCIAAKTACEQGANALVFEEHANIGVPTQCSGLVSKKGLDLLGINYSSAVVNKLNGANIFGLNECVRVKARETKAILLDRRKFDEICASDAEQAGAKIQLGRQVKKNDLNSREQIIVGADGAYSSIAEFFGFPKISGWVVCFQAFFEKAVIEDASSVSVFISNELFPGFFGWVIPENEEACRVGLGINVESSGGNVKKTFDELLKLRQVKEIVGGARMTGFHGGAIPASVRAKTCNERVLLVGDAAGQVKSTTGGGIFFGCSCARIAGKLAATGKVGGYEKTWRNAYEKDLRLHAEIRRFLNSLSDEKLDNYLQLAKIFGAEKFLSEHGEMDLLSGTLEKIKNNPFGTIAKGFNFF